MIVLVVMMRTLRLVLRWEARTFRMRITIVVEIVVMVMVRMVMIITVSTIVRGRRASRMVHAVVIVMGMMVSMMVVSMIWQLRRRFSTATVLFQRFQRQFCLKSHQILRRRKRRTNRFPA